MNQRQYQYSQQSSAQQFRSTDPRQQYVNQSQQIQSTDPRQQYVNQQQRFVPQQVNPYNQYGNNKSETSLPKVNVQQNPYAQKPATQPQQQAKGPLFLFQSEQANINQPVISGLLQNKVPVPQQIDKNSSEDEEEVQNQNEEEEEEEDQDDDEEEQEEENQQEEDADDTEDDNEEDDPQPKQEKHQQKEIKNADKFKSVNEISAIRQEVTKINKELDKLDQEIEGTLIMSRIQYESQTILEMSVSSDVSYQQYLKEFEQFKQLKQSSLMKQ